MNPDPLATGGDPTERNRVTLAFLLGWAVSETIGHLRKGVRPAPPRPGMPPADYSPRLAASNGDVDTTTEAFLFSAERVVEFYRLLGFEAGDKVSPLTQQVNELPAKIRDWLEGKTKTFYTSYELYNLFEDWTMHVWAQLNGASNDSARALTAGMSLADTYWYMRLPSRRKNLKATQTSEEDWRRLLSKYRIDVTISRMRTLKGNLPPYVSDVINNHLKMWSIGTRLCYVNDKLILTVDCKQPTPLLSKDEADLQRALGRQVQNWEAMLFGLREPRTFLQSRDRRLIMYGRWLGMFIADLATALFLLIAAGVVAYFLSITLLPGLLQFLNARQAGVSEWLTVVSLLWTILIADPAPLVLRAAYQFTRGAQGWLDDWLTIFFITRRTYVPWGQYMGDSRQ